MTTSLNDAILYKIDKRSGNDIKNSKFITNIRQEYQLFSLLMMTSKGGLILLALPTVFAVGF